MRDNTFRRIVEACGNINIQLIEDNEDISDDESLISINSWYYDLQDLNLLMSTSSSLRILRTKLASLNTYYEFSTYVVTYHISISNYWNN